MAQCHRACLLAQTMSELVGPIYTSDDYAGFVRRTAALAIDAVILLAALVVVAITWHTIVPEEQVTDRAIGRIFSGWILACFAYQLLLRLGVKGTLGYRLVGIRYAYMLSERPSWTALAFRSVVAVFLLWLFALDHFWILADERKQAWHDTLAGFYVVKRRAEPRGTQRVVRRVINFMMLTFEVWEPATEQSSEPGRPDPSDPASSIPPASVNAPP